MSGAAGAVTSHFRTILSLGAHCESVGRSLMGCDRLSKGLGQVGAERIEEMKENPDGSKYEPHLTRRCS